MPETINNNPAKRVIPCLDVKDGRVVKGINFLNLTDAGDPVECARAYNNAGADELVFLDITASSDGRGTMVDIVRRTADELFIPLTVGGGIRSVDDIRTMLRAGADKTSLNTAAVLNPLLISEGYSSSMQVRSGRKPGILSTISKMPTFHLFCRIWSYSE